MCLILFYSHKMNICGHLHIISIKMMRGTKLHVFRFYFCDPQFTQNKVFSYNRRGLPTLMDFTADQPLKLSAKCSPEDFCLFYTTQVFTVGSVNKYTSSIFVFQI